MKYIIIPKDQTPFLTDWYIYENNYEEGMIVIDTHNETYTLNGVDWGVIEEDRL